MYVGGVPVGDLSPSGTDMPWAICTFAPLPGWDSVRDLFEVQNKARRSRFPPDTLWAFKEIHDRGVELRPLANDTGPVITPMLIYVENGEAHFRR
ncbi:hypothetical protein ACWCQL_37015 [Streptomyces sp. NPDC002073]